MAFFNPNDNQYGEAALQQNNAASVPSVEINSVLKLVYVWMGLGLLVTMVTAWFVGNTPALLQFAVSPGASILTIVVLFGTVIALSAGVGRSWMSPGLAAGLFFLFAAIMGFSLSTIMVAFLSPTVTGPDGTTVVNEFFNPTPVYAAAGSAAALFGAMTLVGFTTKMDLTKMGTYLFIGLIGIIIASLINMFIGSGMLDFLISIAGVVIFTGLTAYDTQKIKRMSTQTEVQNNGSLAVQFSIMGALTLYLDLLNLFLFLLMLFGGGRE